MLRYPLWLCLAFSVATSTGCEILAPESEEESQEEEAGVWQSFCERAEECNYFEGYSVSECVEDYEEMAGDCLPSDRQSLETDVDYCLKKDRCSDFETCLQRIGFCD